MRFKLDENLSPSLADMFAADGHDAHSVVQQALNGQPDARVIDVCAREQRALVTFDLDFSNIQAYPPANYAGIIVLRLTDQSHPTAENALKRVLTLLRQEQLTGTLWIVEESRVRIHG